MDVFVEDLRARRAGIRTWQTPPHREATELRLRGYAVFALGVATILSDVAAIRMAGWAFAVMGIAAVVAGEIKARALRRR